MLSQCECLGGGQTSHRPTACLPQHALPSHPIQMADLASTFSPLPLPSHLCSLPGAFPSCVYKSSETLVPPSSSTEEDVAEIRVQRKLP